MLSNTTSSYTNIYPTNKTKTNVIGIVKFLKTCRWWKQGRKNDIDKLYWNLLSLLKQKHIEVLFVIFTTF